MAWKLVREPPFSFLIFGGFRYNCTIPIRRNVQ